MTPLCEYNAYCFLSIYFKAQASHHFLMLVKCDWSLVCTVDFHMALSSAYKEVTVSMHSGKSEINIRNSGERTLPRGVPMLIGERTLP